MLLARTGGCRRAPRLRVAAAGGRSVPDRLLAAVAGLDEPSLDAALREAVEHHVPVVDVSGPGGYAFRHALTRDAISYCRPRSPGSRSARCSPRHASSSSG